MDEQDFTNWMMDAVADTQAPVDVRSYEDGGVMTSNAGFTCRMDDGSEFQVTVVQSAQAQA